MATENRLRLIHTNLITVPKDRQRTSIPSDYLQELSDSILKPAGLLNPIIVKKDGEERFILVAGECRLKAWAAIENLPPEISAKYRKGIPVRFISDLTEDELFDVEFEENFRRKSLSWQDESMAFNEHCNRQQILYIIEREEAIDEGEDPADWEPDVPFAQAAASIGVSARQYRRMVIVGRKVLSGDKEVLACDSSRAAGAMLDRRMKRIAENELATFGEIEDEIDQDLDPDITKRLPVARSGGFEG